MVAPRARPPAARRGWRASPIGSWCANRPRAAGGRRKQRSWVGRSASTGSACASAFPPDGGFFFRGASSYREVFLFFRAGPEPQLGQPSTSSRSAPSRTSPHVHRAAGSAEPLIESLKASFDPTKRGPAPPPAAALGMMARLAGCAVGDPRPDLRRRAAARPCPPLRANARDAKPIGWRRFSRRGRGFMG